MHPSESSVRAKRAAALEEKKRRLQELKARRSNRSSSNNSLSELSLDSSSMGGGNLEDYIDGLLNSLPPVPVVPKTPPTAKPSSFTAQSPTTKSGDKTLNSMTRTTTNTTTTANHHHKNKALESSSSMTDDPIDSMEQAANGIVHSVQVFTVGTQTDEDMIVDTDHRDEEKDEGHIITHDPIHTRTLVPIPTGDTQQTTIPPVQGQTANADTMSTTSTTTSFPIDRHQTLTSLPFSAFLNSASKKVERLLGAPPIISTLFHEDASRYLNVKDPDDTWILDATWTSHPYHPSTSSSSTTTTPTPSLHPLVTGQISFTCPSWTQNRDITWIDWSCHTKSNELVLVSYSSYPTHLSSSSSSSSFLTSTPIVALSLPLNHPSSTSSTSLFPRSLSECTGTDGLVLVWNVTMPSRPEHVFTCSSTIRVCKFHPLDMNLIIGCTVSGQVVLWDLRNGSRLPVQKSSLCPKRMETSSDDGVGVGGSINGSGIVDSNKKDGGYFQGQGHSIIGMEFILKESLMVTATSNGWVQFWSLTNLSEPVDTCFVPGAHFSSMAIVPETHALILGDENGTVYQLSSNVTSTDSTVKLIQGSSIRSYSSLRRNVRVLHPRGIEESDDDVVNKNSSKISQVGHYGMVTGISTKSSLVSSRVFSKDIPRGAHGLVLTCGVDWTSKLWAPAYTDQPLMTWMSHSYDYMTHVQWSPIHPSVFATSCCDGTIHIWNLSSSMDQPLSGFDGIMVESTSDDSKVLPRGLNHFRWSLDGRRIAVASADTLFVIGMSDEVWKPRADEGKRFMNHLVNRGLLEQDG